MTGHEIKQLRERLGLRQWQLARELGLEQATVSRMETGQSKPSAPVQKLLDMLWRQNPPKKSVKAAGRKIHSSQ